MSPESFLQLLSMGLRFAEAWLKRRPAREQPATRADKMVARVAPLAEKVLERVSPAGSAASTELPKKKRPSAAGAMARATVVSAIVSGTAAYLILQQQRRVRERYQLLHAAFPETLLDVLAAPGGGGRLVFSGASLIDADTGAVFPVVDGIPDFGPAAGAPLAPPTPMESLLELAEPLRLAALGQNTTGTAALAGAVAASVPNDGWLLCAPCGVAYALELARLNSAARLLCVDAEWNTLLELRRQARSAGLTNLYFARGEVTLLPVRDAALAAVWLDGTRRWPAAARVLTQAVRAAQTGARVGGVALAASDLDIALLSASGLREAHYFRHLNAVRFAGVKG